MNGEWKLVLLDDYLLCSKERKPSLSFCKSDESCVPANIWGGLAEKAWAEVHGTYLNCGCGGSAVEALQCLTEAYGTLYFPSAEKKDELWEKIKIATQKKYHLLAGTDVEFDENKTGLYTGHAYSFMYGYDNIPGHPGLRLVKLRNPHGKIIII